MKPSENTKFFFWPLRVREAVFFSLSAGFPPGFGVSGIGGDHQKDPPKIFFLPAKAVVARFARASLQATEWRGEGCTRFDSSHVKLHSCVSGRGGSFGGRGWKLNKVRGLVRVEGDGVCFFYCMALQSLQCCSGNM